MDNVKLSGLLNEAAELLAADSIETLTEVTASTDEGKKLVKEVEDAIKEKDEAKLKKAVAKFKTWFLLPEPEGGKHQKLRDALVIIYAVFVGFTTTFTGAQMIASGIEASATKGAERTKFLIIAVACFISLITLIKLNKKVSDDADEIQGPYMDAYIKKFDDKVKDLKKQLEDYEGDKTSKEYKSIAKAYSEAMVWLDWCKQRKLTIETNSKIKNAKNDIKEAKKENSENVKKYRDEKKANAKAAKEELKEAKKSKDKQEIAEKKVKYKAAKSLVESALEILNSNESLNEAVGVKEKATDKVVKVFKTNKEALEWIIANGGNEVYQLTNRLK